MINVHIIEKTLAGTQCTECGYDGCLPYAEALAAGEASHNLCKPGGETVKQELENLLNVPPRALAKEQAEPQLALIDLDRCVGCTVCLKVCPTAAIVGASKMVHSVITENCTGCGLCVEPCPVDCIDLVDNTKLQTAQVNMSNDAWVKQNRETTWQHVETKREWKEKRRLSEEKIEINTLISDEQMAKIEAARAHVRQKHNKADK